MKFQEVRKNPRFPNRHFLITLILPNNYKLTGWAIDPSAFGATVEVVERDFNYLSENNDWWNNEKPLIVSTRLNDLPACINNLKKFNGKFLVSVKLLNGFNWFTA